MWHRRCSSAFSLECKVTSIVRWSSQTFFRGLSKVHINIRKNSIFSQKHTLGSGVVQNSEFYAQNFWTDTEKARSCFSVDVWHDEMTFDRNSWHSIRSAIKTRSYRMTDDTEYRFHYDGENSTIDLDCDECLSKSNPIDSLHRPYKHFKSQFTSSQNSIPSITDIFEYRFDSDGENFTITLDCH
jgi:hypothetical protein